MTLDMGDRIFLRGRSQFALYIAPSTPGMTSVWVNEKVEHVPTAIIRPTTGICVVTYGPMNSAWKLMQTFDVFTPVGLAAIQSLYYQISQTGGLIRVMNVEGDTNWTRIREAS